MALCMRRLATPALRRAAISASRRMVVARAELHTAKNGLQYEDTVVGTGAAPQPGTRIR